MHKRPHFPRLSSLQWSAIALSVIVFFLSALLVGYFIGFQQAEKELEREREQTQKLIQQIEKIASVGEIDTTSAKAVEQGQKNEIDKLKQELQSILEEEHRKEPVKPQHEYAPSEEDASPPPAAPRPKRLDGTTPKLVIIIDDVSYDRDIRAIQSTGLPLVMSFLPPSPRHPSSASLAMNHKNAMLHLPLEAIHFDDEEPSTLRIGDSEEVIEKRIRELKALFPHVRYVNNHTGSKFTADQESMEKLIAVLKKEGMVFVDSRTIGTTKAPQAAAAVGMRYMGRDVFLDHKEGVRNVKRQIKEAVAKAKRHGSAIAIGHPRPDTIQALIESKDILSDVELVGIDKI
jgi:uncharacterized protein